MSDPSETAPSDASGTRRGDAPDGAGPARGAWMPYVWVALAVLVIGWLTLRPGRPPGLHSIRPPWSCLICGTYGGADALLNVALFVPFGLALAFAGLPAALALGVALVTSGAIEVAQATVIPFRHPALGDVVWNTTGGLAGALLLPHVHTLVFPTARAARRLAAGATALVVTLVMLTAVALRPSTPRQAVHVQEFGPCRVPAPDSGAWIPTLRYGDVPVARGQEIAAGALAAAWRDGTLVVTGVTNPGSCESLHALVSSAGDVPDEWVGFNRDAMSVTFRLRLRAADLRLRQPWVTVPARYGDLFGTSAARVHGGYARGRLFVGVRGGAGETRADALLSLGAGWSLLYPFGEALNVDSHLLNVAWVIVLLLPVGFYLGASLGTEDARARGPRLLAIWGPPAVATLAVVAGDRVAVGAFVGEDFVAVLLGLLIGAAAHSLAGRVPPRRPVA